ncbi:TetR/AcrR family transcriptional regulator [Janibacter limosus]|jgi:AcrR family transcriptional regulator|uniref:TetR/AcrR family transcriptional regulator n=1 Tax=Janibacter limosus TaxID=53458 RepID=A0A4V0ZAN7_9MICO|nr:TetR/AcrR family transcriptional regulator [Janibacter limosus]QBF45138.1 TetR/AcrR family transcriptional regulator [Janibacter limosus]
MSTHESATLSPRMRLILESATKVVAAGGMRGLTHRAVDAEAGLSQGSTSGYLRTRLALVSALAEFIAAGLIDSVEELAGEQQAGEPVATVVEHALDLFAGWLREPEALLAKAELAQEAMRQPEVAEALEPARLRIEGIVGQILVRAGVGDVQTSAQAIIAAMEGVLASALAKPTAEREAYVREVGKRIITAFVPTVG